MNLLANSIMMSMSKNLRINLRPMDLNQKEEPLKIAI